MLLERFGWNTALDEAFAPRRKEGLEPARVVVQERGAYVVVTEAGERPAEITGRLRHEARPGDLPVAGDWVAVRPDAAGERATVHEVLPRRSAFVRKAAGDAHAEQVLAANLDVTFLMAALPDPNLRRLERFLAAAWESGAEPVVVLSKRDLVDDVEAAVARAETVAIGVPVHAVSARTGEGLDVLRPLLLPNRTAALLGISGAGKSTLVNLLLGDERQAVAAVRDDGKGRHTTTQRELFALPGGGVVLDTPGMREFGLWDAGSGLEDAFDDVAALAAGCRFSDCTHEAEPGCAVLAAVTEGRLAEERLASYRKLGRELAYQERRGNPAAEAENRRRWRKVHKELKRSQRDA